MKAHRKHAFQLMADELGMSHVTFANLHGAAVGDFAGAYICGAEYDSGALDLLRKHDNGAGFRVYTVYDEVLSFA